MSVSVRIRRPLISLSLIAAATFVSSCGWHEDTRPGLVTVKLDNARPAQPRPVVEKPAPLALQSRIDTLGKGFAGNVGIAVRDVSSSWSVSYHPKLLAPQQSVSKLWVSIALLDAVDRGRVSLDETVVVGPQDLTVFHQPIRVLVGAKGYRTTIEKLMRFALERSDNTANDMLLRRVGGPDAIRTMLALKQLDQISFGPGERLLQASIAGLDWRPGYSIGSAFIDARAKLPKPLREAALSRYLATPIDGATPDGVTRALVRLKRGELLSPASTALLLSIMESSRTGHARLRAGLAPGWTLAHKTGTGQELGSRATGFNDIGLLTGPSGRSYAVAVMIADTRAPIGQRQQLMADVARAVIAYDDSLRVPEQTASTNGKTG